MDPCKVLLRSFKLLEYNSPLGLLEHIGNEEKFMAAPGDATFNYQIQAMPDVVMLILLDLHSCVHNLLRSIIFALRSDN